MAKLSTQYNQTYKQKLLSIITISLCLLQLFFLSCKSSVQAPPLEYPENQWKLIEQNESVSMVLWKKYWTEFGPRILVCEIAIVCDSIPELILTDSSACKYGFPVYMMGVSMHDPQNGKPFSVDALPDLESLVIRGKNYTRVGHSNKAKYYTISSSHTSSTYRKEYKLSSEIISELSTSNSFEIFGVKIDLFGAQDAISMITMIN